MTQKFVGKVDSCIEVASSVALQVENHILHSLLLKFFHCFLEFFGSRCPEAVDADIACLRLNHIGRVKAEDRYLVSFYGEHQRVLDAATDNFQIYFRAFRTAKTLHDFFRTHLYTCNGAVVDGDDTVACKDSYFLGRTVADRLHHQQRIFNHLELYADAFEITLKRFVHLLHFFGVRVGGVRVELGQHFNDSFFYQLVFVYFIYIKVGDCKLCHLQLAHGGRAETLGLYG